MTCVACGDKMPASLQRTATSRYTTADSSEPGDMMCQICLGPLRSCLALQPCGHNFCAACLSHHFASLLQVISHLYHLPNRVLPVAFAHAQVESHPSSANASHADAPPPAGAAASLTGLSCS